MCKSWDNPITDYWLKHYLDEKTGFCSLCGQSGVIHTEGIHSPAGIEVGRSNYCICPNGQAKREAESNKNKPTQYYKLCVGLFEEVVGWTSNYETAQNFEKERMGNRAIEISEKEFNSEVNK